VTVLFCDVAGSTALAESKDPEALRTLLARYFERMKRIVEAHGGTVEKFIGDAVMAVFGVPTLHEDDALRACRAAVEMRDAFPELGINGRIGVTTGEVVTGTPLDAAETEQLLDELGGVEPGLRRRIVTAAEGNPLFLEEMLALVRASGHGEISVPPTIQALLAARLDQLDPAERAVLERGSVEGYVFHESAVQALGDGEPLTPLLAALVRKQLIRPDSPQFGGGDAYRFRHLLISDAAYDALTKAVRADLHGRFADWLEERAADLVELDEILGVHRIAPRPVVRDGEVVVRPMGNVSVTFDHRVVDGARAAEFVLAVIRRLEASQAG
jgi:hypothetical protein